MRLCVHVVCGFTHTQLRTLNTVFHVSGCLQLKSYSCWPLSFVTKGRVGLPGRTHLLSPARALSLGFCAGARGAGRSAFTVEGRGAPLPSRETVQMSVSCEGSMAEASDSGGGVVRAHSLG